MKHDPQIISRFATLDGLIVALVQRRHARGLSQLAMDEISGLQSGYTAKIERGIKGLGQVSLPSMLGALGCELALIPAVRTPRTHREESIEFHENHMSRNARKAVIARWAKTTPKQRRKIARAAAKARWSKARAEVAADLAPSSLADPQQGGER